MKQKTSRLLSVALALCMALALLPGAALAADSPVESNNIYSQVYEYGRWATTVNSYLCENESGGLTRVEYTGGKITVEDYDSSFRFQSGRSIDMELDIWGGFFAGENYNFFVFGQENPNEDNSKEVIRVVKYSKDWKRLGQASLNGANTVIPFDAGSLRFAEYNGELYIRTCHEMYKSSDGKNHQANLTMAVQESDMTVKDSYYIVMNSSYGYVSHSFNQFVIVDQEQRIVTLDHGDANPRSAVLMVYNTKAGNGKFSGNNIPNITIQEFPGARGNNDTGASLGGLAETSSGYVVAYNYDGAGSSRTSADRSVYFAYVDKNSRSVTTKAISSVGTMPPFLAPTGLDGGYILWNASSANGAGTNELYYAAYSATGTVGTVKKAEASTSDCQPIVYNGKVVWYATKNSAPVFYQLDENGVTAVQATVSAATPLTKDMFTVDVSGETYDGSPKTKNVTGTYAGTPLVEDTDYTVTYSGNTNAGTASITISGMGMYSGALTYNFTIGRANRSLTAAVNPSQLAVGGPAAAVTLTDNASAEAPTYTYSSSDTSVATVSGGTVTPVGAGEAVITVSAPATANYQEGSAAVTVAVSTLPVQDLSFANDSIAKTYGDPAFTNAAVNSTAGGGAVTYASSDTDVATVDSDGAVTVKGAGETVITATAAQVDGQYAQTSASCTLTVSPKSVSITGADAADKTYDGTTDASVTGVTFDGVVAGDTLTPGTDYTVDAQFADAAAGSGKEVTVTVTLNNKNYSLSTSTFKTTANITKLAFPALSCNTTLRTTAGSTREIDLSALAGWPEGLGSAALAAETDSGSGLTAAVSGNVLTLTSKGTKAAGDTETVRVTVSDAANYENGAVAVSVTYTIKEDVTIGGVTVSDKVYDGKAADIKGSVTAASKSSGEAVTVDPDEFGYVWTDMDSGKVLDDAPVNAGKYRLTVTLDNDSYEGELAINFTVRKATVVVRPGDVTIYAGRALPTEFELTYTGLVKGETSDVLDIGSVAPTFELKNGAKELENSNTTGTYTIEWTNKGKVVIEADNYEIEKKDGTLYIRSVHSGDSGSSGGGSSGGGSSSGGGGSSGGGATSGDGPSTAPTTPGSSGGSVSVRNPGGANGSVSSNVSGARRGDKVTVSSKADSGYISAAPNVIDKNGNAVDVVKNPDGTYSFIMPEGGVTVTGSFVTPNQLFSDLSDGAWYRESIAYAVENGLMNGVGGGQFDPGGTTTRGMIMTILARQFGVDTTASSGEPWYQKGMDWARQAGVSDGTSPEASVTREQLAAMLWRFAGEPAAAGSLASYPDAGNVSGWAGSAMIWAVQNGIINGSDGKLNPQGNAIRSEAAAMLTRFCQNIQN